MLKIRKILPILILLCFSFQVLGVVINFSPTNDEPGHITAGYSYLKYGDLRFNAGGPLLLNLFTSFPLQFLPLKNSQESKFWDKGYLHGVAKDFLLSNPSIIDKVFILVRLPILILGIFLGILIFRWSEELFGRVTALIALILFSFEPNLITHSGLATTDLGATLFIFGTIYYFWHYLNYKKKKDLLIFIIFFLMAQLTKITCLILFPLILFLSLINDYQKNRLIFSFKLISLLVISFVFSVNLFYSFQGLGKSLIYFLNNDTALHFAGYNIDIIKNLILKGGIFSKFFEFLIAKLPLPISYHYLKTLGWVIYRSKMGHPAFLAGNYSQFGWWYYYPFAFLIKTSLPLIIFLLIFGGFGFRKEIAKQKIKDFLFILLPIFGIFIFSFFNHINAGLRYILPIYPFIIILAAKGGEIILRRQKFLFLILSLWLVICNLKIFPHYLAYFNELIGGPKNGYRFLLDSNLDWGQDVKGLVKFIKKNKIDDIKVNLFGIVYPDSYGVDYQWFGPSWLKEEKEKQLPCREEDGWLAISVNQLQGVYLEDKNCFGWLKKEKPVKVIGYSIFIYKR